MNANRHDGSSPLPYHKMENIIVTPAAKSSSRTSYAVLDSSWNFLATSTQAEKGILPVVWTKPASPSSPRRLRFAILASPSSLRHPCLAVLASPSSPRHPRLAVFASPSSPRHPRLAVFASPSSPRHPRHPRLAILATPSRLATPSSPRHPRHAILATPSSPRHPRLTVFARARFSSSPSSWNVAFLGPAALFCPMVDHPWGGAVALRLRAP
ncbi:hypothetical protein OUZ56_022217 [Daphnia magna]|uniref:Uncharacterized protein n=1 Tax=Daphnia magna TaxID=35525 RepID=A0ABR0AVP9_9CRUS|nr:hypothetical protein OUZ56_022217 [Daphnia magna]